VGVVAVVVLALPVSPGAARSDAACELPGYSYAGYVSSAPVHAVGATITAERTPQVAGGHVAAWVGVGSLHAGPHRSNEWLQAGLVSYGGSSFRLYVESATPGASRRYFEVGRSIAPGERHHVAVVESSPGSWQAKVDGRAAGPSVFLPGTEGGLPSMATAESWATAHSRCNGFHFAFDELQLGTAKQLELRSPFNRLVRRQTGFSAAA
jgi:hypothetical protein